MSGWLNLDLNFNSRIIPNTLLDKGKRTTVDSCLQWMQDHAGEIDHFIQECYTPNDLEFIHEWFWENPRLCRSLIIDYFRSNTEKINEIVNTMIGTKSKIMMIVGGRGSGKTASGFWCAEQIKDTRQVYYSGEETGGLPDWIKVTDDPVNTPTGSFILTDEVGIQYSARGSMFSDKSRWLSQQLMTLRHDNKTIAFMTQNTRLSDVNIYRLADVFIYKKPSSMQMSTDRMSSNKRDYIQDLINTMMPRQKKETLYVSGNRIMKFNQPLPTFWSDKLSKSWESRAKDNKDQEIEATKEREIKLKKEIADLQKGFKDGMVKTNNREKSKLGVNSQRSSNFIDYSQIP